MLARLLTLFISSLLVLFSAGPTLAQSATVSALPSYVAPTSPAYMDLMVFNMFHTFSCLSIGSSLIGQPCLTYQLQKNTQGALQSIPVLSQANLSGGALGITTSLLAGLYDNRPIRTTDYLASVEQDLGIIKEARAQGVNGSGADVLHPVLILWQVSRNIAYIIMIVIFVAIGLMVMFRQRINPQTVITAQAALPSLVIGLILITFSYFLASLLTDVAFVSTNTVGYYFQTAKNDPAPGNPNQPPNCAPGTSPNNLVDCTKNENALSIMGHLMNGIQKDEIANFLGTIIAGLDNNGLLSPQRIVTTFAAISAYQVGNTIGPAIGSLISGTACGIAAVPLITGGLLGGVIPAVGSVAAFTACAGGGAEIANLIGGPIVGGIFSAYTLAFPGAAIGFALWIIALGVIIYTMFKLLFRLINSFLQIIFLTITAPFHFLVASLPGRQGVATNWILNMLCNILAFPAVMGVFYFINFILGSANTSFTPFQIGGEPNLTNHSTLPLLGGLAIPINILLAFGALIATPTIPDIICKAIGREGPAGQMLGQAISGNIGAGRNYFGQAQQGVGKIAAQIEEFRDRPGYEMNSTTGQLQRIDLERAKRLGYDQQKLYQAGYQPGKGRKTSAK